MLPWLKSDRHRRARGNGKPGTAVVSFSMTFGSRGLGLSGLLGLLTAACVGGGASSKSAAVTGCEDSCRYVFSCVFLAAEEDQGEVDSTCARACGEIVPELDDECREAYAAFGECSSGLSCEDFEGGACADEMEAANAACEDSAAGSDFNLTTGGTSETDGPDPSEGSDESSGDAPDSCEAYEFEVSGEACDGTCATVQCECDPFPSSFTACTPDGCVTAANCDAVCDSGLADLFDCTDTYTLPDGTHVSDDSTTVIEAGPTDGPSDPATVPNGPVIIVDGPAPDPSNACTPLSCTSEGANCGTIDDGCGGELQCGFCSPPETCGGAGESNQCGCTPIECSDVSAECGAIDDGCGGEVDCGGCGDTDWCGGGGEANACGCAPSGMSEGIARLGSSVEGIGTEPWADLESISAIDDSQGSTSRAGSANVNLTGGQETHWLVGSDFGLDVPDNTTIAGIEVSIYRRGYSLGNIADNAVRLVKDGSIMSYDQAAEEDWGTTSLPATYGGEADLWDGEWTAADLRDPSFGVALSARYTTTAGNSWALVDAISVRVYYTAECQ